MEGGRGERGGAGPGKVQRRHDRRRMRRHAVQRLLHVVRLGVEQALLRIDALVLLRMDLLLVFELIVRRLQLRKSWLREAIVRELALREA